MSAVKNLIIDLAISARDNGFKSRYLSAVHAVQEWQKIATGCREKVMAAMDSDEFDELVEHVLEALDALQPTQPGNLDTDNLLLAGQLISSFTISGDRGYVFINRGGGHVQPFVVAYYRSGESEWGSGNYFATFADAWKFFVVMCADHRGCNAEYSEHPYE